MKYSFANCRVDTARRELSRNGTDVHLSPKAYDLLLLLIERRPGVMSKQELMNELWPNTFVVEANLHVLIGELRSALGEKSSRTGSIKTHHGIGYSFTADVHELQTRLRLTRARSRTVLVAGSRRIELADGSHQVGRDAGCEVVFNDVSVSRRHARLITAGESLAVEDLGSKNGTLVNGTRVEKTTPLTHGDEITFGSVRTTIEISRAAQSTLTI